MNPLSIDDSASCDASANVYGLNFAHSADKTLALTGRKAFFILYIAEIVVNLYLLS